jgi:hypothetical protein
MNMAIMVVMAKFEAIDDLQRQTTNRACTWPLHVVSLSHLQLTSIRIELQDIARDYACMYTRLVMVTNSKLVCGAMSLGSLLATLK